MDHPQSIVLHHTTILSKQLARGIPQGSIPSISLQNLGRETLPIPVETCAKTHVQDDQASFSSQQPQTTVFGHFDSSCFFRPP